ncbi:heavy-metal-associated domain-containing protein [Bacillus sp. SCS-153A]|uniref:heavy-metal-associated domain-containing protein n=1 Tax=Rossellomorea sedimentorum TaxID=3115294 RepID=UPI0039060BD7
MAEEYTLYVKEATERGTIQELENILLEMDGVERALVDTEDGEVKISYDESRLSRQEVVETIQQNGFQVT